MQPTKDPLALQDEVLVLGESVVLSQIDARKVQVAAWDKLVVLNAGALAVTITASVAFRGHTNGDGGIGYLFGSWEMLISSIVLAVVAQWLGAMSLQHLPLALYGKLMADRIERLERTQESIFDRSSAQARTDWKRSNLMDRCLWISAAAAGAASVLCSIVALTRFYSFVHTNLTVVLRA